MKKNLIVLAIILMSILLNFELFAQEKQTYVPEKGCWQLVWNKKDKKIVTVKFYNEQNEMIYEETVYHTKMNADRTKVRRQLFYALQDAYNQWALHQRINSTDLIAKRK